MAGGGAEGGGGESSGMHKAKQYIPTSLITRKDARPGDGSGAGGTCRVVQDERRGA